MFEKILFPTDFSEVAAKALTYVKGLKDCGGREVTVLHVIDTSNLEFLRSFSDSYGTTFGQIPDATTLEKEILRSAAAELNPIAETLRQAGLSVRERLEVGIPLRAVLQTAEEEEPDVIVVGSHGKSNLEEVLLGSVSEKIVRKATQPVLVIKR